MKQKTVILLFILASIAACTTPDQEILGKWRVNKIVRNGKDVTHPPAGSSLIENRYDMATVVIDVEFCKDGKCIHYYNDTVYRRESVTYKIEGDSIFWTAKRPGLDGYIIEKHSDNYLLEANKLTLGGSDSSHIDLERVKK